MPRDAGNQPRSATEPNPYRPPTVSDPPEAGRRECTPRAARGSPGREPALSVWHAAGFLLLWLPFTAATAWIVWRGLDDAPRHPDRVLLTVAATLLGPLTGAISRGAFQGCCLEVSLQLLAYSLPWLLVCVVLQWLWRPRTWFKRLARLSLWMLGWFAWFASGIVSLGHALS